jgi:nickel-dependent lactate racemase
MAETLTPPSVALPWGAWYADTTRAFPVPAHWSVNVLRMADAPPLSDLALEAALDAPAGAPALSDVARGARTAAIAVDDLTRPTRAEALVTALLRRLNTAGIDDQNIAVVIASGAHREASARDITLKLGSAVVGRVRVEGHAPHRDLVDTGVRLGGVPVRINRTFAEADVRIGVGAVLPHPFAGFGGGGKIVIPGLADLDVLARTHKYALMGLSGNTGLEGNRFRADMEQAVRTIGLHWTLNVVVNGARDTAHVVGGDMVEAHRAAAQLASVVGRTAVPSALLDALVVNAYPKDGELLQIESALVALRGDALSWLRPGAPIVLTAACSEGCGTHHLFGPGGRLFRPPMPRRSLGDHPLVIFAEGQSRDDAHKVFWDGYRFASIWEEVVKVIGETSAAPRVGILPCGPLQTFEPRDTTESTTSR